MVLELYYDYCLFEIKIMRKIRVVKFKAFRKICTMHIILILCGFQEKLFGFPNWTPQFKANLFILKYLVSVSKGVNWTTLTDSRGDHMTPNQGRGYLTGLITRFKIRPDFLQGYLVCSRLGSGFTLASCKEGPGFYPHLTQVVQSSSCELVQLRLEIHTL